MTRPRPSFALSVALLLLVTAGVFARADQAPSAPVAGQPASPPADHVIVISIDGFRPVIYLDAEREGVTLPNLQALRAAGSAAEGMVVAHPSLTYVSHTSLATGVRPARHGIISNTKFDPPAGSPQWYYEVEAMKVPAIWCQCPGGIEV